MNLYTIDEQIRILLDQGFNEECIDAETGEILEEKAQKLLEDLQGQRNEKIENIALYIKDLSAKAEAIKQEEQRLSERRKAKEKKIEWMKQFLTTSLLSSSTEKFESARVCIGFRKSEKIIIENEAALEDKYITVETKRTPNKKALKEAIKAGAAVQGAHIQESKNIQIK
ncbi:MAG: siphovirus Gp157 family protein [Clostridiales bacterium]|nr:siphovirus Gp157 family protein [Clostridiales bacterium]